MPLFKAEIRKGEWAKYISQRKKSQKVERHDITSKNRWWSWSWVPNPMRSVCKTSWFLGVFPFSNTDLNSALRGKIFRKDGKPWTLPAFSQFFSALHLMLTLTSSYSVGRLNFARIMTEWRQGSPLVPRFAMTGATALHAALAITTVSFAFRRRRRTLAVICDAKRLIKRAKDILGDEIDKGVGILGRYSYALFILFCAAKAETALQMLAETEQHVILTRSNTTLSTTTIDYYDEVTSNSTETPSQYNVTSEPKSAPAFLSSTDAFFSSFFNAQWAVPAWLQQAPFMWVQFASIACEGQMTALCAVLRSCVAALNIRLVLLLGRRGQGLARSGGEDEAWRGSSSKPIGISGQATTWMTSRRGPDSPLHRGWSHWFKKRKGNVVEASLRGSGAHFYGLEWRNHGAIDGKRGAMKTTEIAAKPLSRELSNLRRLFGSMMDMNDGINRRFGDELLVNTIGGRLAAVLTLYAVIFIIFDHRYRPSEKQSGGRENRSNYLTLYLLILFFQLFVYLSRLIYVCYACHRVCSVVSRTRVLLQEFKGEILDKNSSDELTIFCAQLESRSVEFSAGGFFVVDLRFLHSLLGSLFTYLIILIQFQTP